jgi:S1-C subfamily serine protease
MKLITAYIYIILGLLSIETGCQHCQKALAQVPPPVVQATNTPSYLQSASLAIRCGEHAGSGFCVRDGKQLFVWTAAHVLQDRQEEPVILSQGDMYCVADIIQCEESADLALLSVVNPPDEWKSVHFTTGIPPAGVRVYHVGNFLGLAPGSFSTGVISFVGRTDPRLLGPGAVPPMDQIDCMLFPGSSGGGVFLSASGQCVGIVVRQWAPGFSFMIPARVVREWATKNGVEFAL